MQTSPARTKQALQEIAKIFNRLAFQLTADLTSAVKEIDVLKREIERLKTSSGKANRSSTQKKTASSKTSHTNPTKKTPKDTSHHEGTPSAQHESVHDTKPSGETGSFVFPHEPFNPTPPPEPTPPGNN